MTTKCANPACDHPFHYFRSGKIYLIDTVNSNGAFRASNGTRGTEYFWLCGECSKNLRVTLDGQGAVKVERLAEPLPERRESTSTTSELPRKPIAAGAAR